MADKIDIIISGDKSLNENVKQAKKIETSIENAYKSWSKLADGKGNAHISETVKQMEKLTVQSKKYNKEIETQTKEQKKLDQITKEYNSTLKKSNQIQTSYATDLQKTNAQLEVLKKNQKLLKVEGKELTAEYQRNKVAIKEISAEYRKLEKIQLQEIQMKKTLASLGKKENLTLKEQKQLFSALNIQYNKLVTEEGKASRETLTLQKRMDKLNASILRSEKAVRLHQRNVGNYPQAFGKMAKSANGAMLAIMAIGMAISKAFNAAKRFVEMNNAQILSEKKLAVVMKQRMGATNTQIKSILNLTSAQQKLGVVGDEVQIAGAQQLSTFLKQDDSLKQLIPAMNNLIVQQKGMNGTQQDAVMIANLFGKVMDGQVSALTRVGISLTDAQKELIKYGDETQRASVLSQVITANVGNMNEEFAKTDAGKMQQAKNELGDLGEELGGKLLPLLAEFLQTMLKIANGIKNVVDYVEKLTTKTNDLSDSQKRQNDYNEKLNKTISIERAEINKLLSVARNEKRSKEERLAAVKSLNAISPEYLGNITLETINTNKTTSAINNYITALKEKVKAQLAVEKSTEIISQIFDKEIELQEMQFTIDEQRVAQGMLPIYGTIEEAKERMAQKLGDTDISIDFTNIPTNLDAQTQSEVDAKLYEQMVKPLEDNAVLLQNEIDNLNLDLTHFNELTGGIELDNLAGKITAIDNATQGYARTVQQIDIYAQKVGQLNAEISSKELELRRKYKDDSEQIELELLEFKQVKQLELLRFVEDNDLNEHQIESDLKYLDITKSLNAKREQIEQQKYNDLYDDYQDYLTKKELADEKYLLEMKGSGADEVQIEFEKLAQKKQLLSDYLKFLEDNANDQNEIERLQLQNQLLDIETQLSNFEFPTKEEDDKSVASFLGISQEDFEQLKGILADSLNNYINFLAEKYNAEIEYSQKKRELLESEIQAEYDYQQSQRDGLDFENKLRNENFENDALLTESLIRASKDRVEAKKKEQQALLIEEQKSAEKLKKVQKAQIYAQFAMDSASAISSLIKFAFANPLNSIAPATAFIQIATGMLAITAGFLKARSSIKGLKDGEVDIVEGSGTRDDVPALLMKGESVITKSGTKKAKNFLTGLNKDATKDQLVQLLSLDFGQNALKEHNIFVNIEAYEQIETNRKLQQNIQQLEQNNLYLSKLLSVTENKPDYIPLPNGYKKITQNSETTIIIE